MKRMYVKSIAAALALSLLLAGCAGQDGNSSSATEPFYYEGPFVDVVAEQEDAAASSSIVTVRKVDEKTDLPLGATIEVTDDGKQAATVNTVRVPYEGETYTLVFRDNVLQGYHSSQLSIEEVADFLQDQKLDTDEDMMTTLFETYTSLVDGLIEG